MENLFIKTDRLTIRDLRRGDLEEFYAYRSDPEVTRYQNFTVMTKEEAGDFINDNSLKLFGAAGEWVQYAIENSTDKQLIGDCAIKLDSNDLKIAEVGITISPRYQKNGFAKKTLLGLAKWLFEAKGIDSIKEIVDAENIASIRLLKSAGFIQRGEEKKMVLFKGKYGSEFQFEMNKQNREEKKI